MTNNEIFSACFMWKNDGTNERKKEMKKTAALHAQWIYTYPISNFLQIVSLFGQLDAFLFFFYSYLSMFYFLPLIILICLLEGNKLCIVILIPRRNGNSKKTKQFLRKSHLIKRMFWWLWWDETKCNEMNHKM